jgi:uncharacterized protein
MTSSIDPSSAFLKAITAGDRETAFDLLAGDSSLARLRDARGVPAILVTLFAGHGDIARRLAEGRQDLDVFEAAALGDLARVRAILATSPAVARAFAADGFTALHYAAHLGHLEIVEELVRAGADVRAVAKGPIDAMPHHSAIAGGRAQIAAYLLDRGAPVDATYEGGRTALHVAAASGNVDCVRALLAHGATIDALDREGKRPLAYAEQYERAEAAAILADRARARD